MFCRYCGSHIPDDSLFCAKCGRRLGPRENPRQAAWFDQWVVDGLVNASAYATLAASYTSVGFDTYVVDGLVNLAGYTVRGASWTLRRLQTGVVQTYATAMILGVFILVSVYLLTSSH